MKCTPLHELQQNKEKQSNKDNFSFYDNLKKAFELDKENDSHKKLDGYFSISQFTGDSCLRKIYYDVKNPEFKKEYKFEKDFVFKFGHSIHELIQSKMSKFNLLHGVEQFFQDDENKICGSTDGYYIDHDKKEIRMLDIKTTNLGLYSYVLMKNVPKKDHKHQLNVYAYYLLKEYPEYQIKSMHILYINKNQSNHVNDMSRLSLSAKTLNDVDEKEMIENHIETIKSLFNDEDMKIKEVIFDYDEEIALSEINKVKELREKIKNNKLPNKISKKIYCLNCDFVNMCRGKEWVEENK